VPGSVKRGLRERPFTEPGIDATDRRAAGFTFIMRLFDYPASGNCYKVRLLVAHLGLTCEVVTVDIATGETLTHEYLARNPAGRTPVLETDEGESIAESGAILLYLARGTELLPDDALGQARVHQWLFFEQNLLEPNLGTARFWRLTGRAALRPEAWERHREAGQAALEVIERHLQSHDWLALDRFTVADIAVYAYAHVADEAGIDTSAYPALRAWVARVAALPRHVAGLAPYPPSLAAGAGARSAHDPPPAGA
jgi:glutathione S-transferase